MPSSAIYRSSATSRTQPTRQSPRRQVNDHGTRRSRLARPVRRPVLPDRAVGDRARLRLLAVQQKKIRPGRPGDPSRRRQAMPLERDPQSGYLTTGHEWNGIKELNTPVPRLVFLFLILAALFSLGYWVLMPAWPVGSTYTKGLLGNDQRAIVTEAVKQAAAARSVWTDQIASRSFAEIEADPRLMAAVRQTGHTLFGDNCAVCHGRDAKG